MGKILSVIGYLFLAFITFSNYANISLSNTAIILLGIISAIFMCVGIIIKDKK
jgi:hypothetical protein